MATTLFGVNLQHVSAGISGALDYWGESMRSILPNSLQKRLTVGEEQLIVFLADDAIHVQQNVNGNITELGSFAQAGELIDNAMIKLVKKTLTRDRELLLVVPDDVVLSKPIDFPAAAEENLHQALLYEMDKHTPFPKADVLFDTQIEHRHAAKLQARLYLLHRSQVSDVLTAFQQAKIRFDRVCAEHQRQINLLPEVLRRKQAIIPYKRNWFFALVFLGLLAIGFALPLYFKRDAAIQLEAKMAQLNVQAAGEGELWERRDAGEQVVLDFIDAYPMPFSQIYEELSKRLPDDTWLNLLVYQKGKITMHGEGKDAAGLIKKVNSSSLFKNARFASPIVKSYQDKNREVFNITFEAVTTTTGEASDDQ